MTPNKDGYETVARAVMPFDSRQGDRSWDGWKSETAQFIKKCLFDEIAGHAKQTKRKVTVPTSNRVAMMRNHRVVSSVASGHSNLVYCFLDDERKEDGEVEEAESVEGKARLLWINLEQCRMWAHSGNTVWSVRRAVVKIRGKLAGLGRAATASGMSRLPSPGPEPDSALLPWSMALRLLQG
jgi:hypothetical protein